MMAKLLFAWFLLAVGSALLYAFADITFWMPLDKQTDIGRFMILAIFHVGGFIAYWIHRGKLWEH